MATAQEKPAAAAAHINETSPLRDDGYNQEFEESNSSSSGCGCMGGFAGGDGTAMEVLDIYCRGEEIREIWLKKKAKKVRETSEVLAGPRWKNFIRGFSKKRRSMLRFQYDPQSYELNFDEGIHREVDAGFPDFSARFAAPSSGIHKGEMGLGRYQPYF